MNSRSQFKLISIALLTVAQTLGMGGVVRSASEGENMTPTPIPTTSPAPLSTFQCLFLTLKKVTSTPQKLARMVQALIRRANTSGRCNDIQEIAAIGQPSVALLIPLLKNKDDAVQSLGDRKSTRLNSSHVD